MGSALADDDAHAAHADAVLSSLAPLCGFLFSGTSEGAVVARSASKAELVKMGSAAAVGIASAYSPELFCLLEEHGLEGLRRAEAKAHVARLSQLVDAAGFNVESACVSNATSSSLFGHAVARALWACGLSLPASSCVALGVMKEAEVSRALRSCAAPCIGRIDRCLKAFGLPNKVPHDIFTSKPWAAEAVVRALCDGGDHAPLCLLGGIGETAGRYARMVPRATIARVISTHVTLSSKDPVCGTVRVPGSKSMSNRVLLLAGIAKGECLITGLLHSDDTQVMMSALAQLGAKFGVEAGGDALLVTGNGGVFSQPATELYMSNAGTATRFMITLLTLVGRSSGKSGRTVLTGSSRMLVRPQGPLVKALKAHGCDIEYMGKKITYRSTSRRRAPRRIASPRGKSELAICIVCPLICTVCGGYA